MVAAAGDVTLSAGSTATIWSLAIGGALAGALSTGAGLTGAVAGAGAGTLNTVNETIEAYIKDGSSVKTTNHGNVTLTATDGTQVNADAGGVAIAIAIGGEGNLAGSIGAAIAVNTVANTVHADIDGSLVTAGGGVSISAKSQANPDQTLTFEPSAVNTSTNQITLTNHGLHTGDRVVYQSAGGAATEIGGLQDGQSYFVVKVDANTIELVASKAEALQTNPTPIALKSSGSGDQSLVTLTPTIDGLAMGGAGAGAGGEGLDVALAGAGAGVLNSVDNDIEAYIKGCSSTVTPATKGVTATQGSVSLTASDDGFIRSDAGGFAAAFAIGGLSAAATVGASVGDNEIGQKSGQFVKAYIDSSTVSASGSVTLTTFSTAQIDARSMGGSLALGGSEFPAAGALAGRRSGLDQQCGGSAGIGHSDRQFRHDRGGQQWQRHPQLDRRRHDHGGCRRRGGRGRDHFGREQRLGLGRGRRGR